ncbi:liprin-beta-1 isoform X2 [Pectinophora gossypiella]|uniref:liprin-beta-1 isoform X2 n=1 Tax=Pectinophora gossypiella TaxID=13191 RepID=UPI00214F2F9A|nr:liprin-beta-1 isoform X2 [Pectinophora gossypiella]
MRELGRGGSLVAATIAALHNRTAIEEKSRAIKRRPTSAEARNVPRTIREEHDECSRRASGCSERPVSTASEASEHDSASVQSSEEPPPHESGDSDSPEEATVKCTKWPDGAVVAARADSSDTESSSSSDVDSDEQEYEPGRADADYRTLTPSRRLDNSTRRDDSFKWMPPEDMGEDIGEPISMETRAEEYSSASLDRRRRTPGDRSDRDRKSRSSMSSKPPQHPSHPCSVRASPRPRRSRPEEASPELQRRWNSYEHFRWPEGGPTPWWPPMCWCHGPPAPPPCCMHDRSWPSHPSLPPVPARTYKNDAEERVRRLEADKESLQLQVQVLSEQIAAQSEKMSDLERALHDARQRLDDAEQRLQKEMLQRSSLETQKLELLSKLSEARLRAVERGVLERSPPPADITPVARPAPPRTPPANYGRQIERNTHMYSSLPRSSIITSEARVAFGKQQQHNMVVARGRGHSVPNLAEKEEAIPRGSPSPSLREVRARLGSGSVRLEGDELARGDTRASLTAHARPNIPAPWQTTDVRQWDCETTCGWLESLGLESYVPAARTWLNAAPDARGVIAVASHHTIEKELAIKHPMHKKKIVLALTDLLGGHGDALLTAAGQLDTAWALRWLEDVGLCGARAAAADAALDGRALHRLAHHELHAGLRVTLQLHALSVRRGIQVLRDNKFNPDTMIRRAVEGEAAASGAEGEAAPGLARWSSHRVMQWLKEIDLAEYAPNLRGAGVHGGLMLLEPRFTAELLAALLNIPANKTLLRRHLTQRFNDLLGREVIQQKRNAEQTLGYQPLTATTKYKVPKKSQFSLKRKKSKDELDLGDLVCPLHDDSSDDESKISGSRRVGCLSPA